MGQKKTKMPTKEFQQKVRQFEDIAKTMNNLFMVINGDNNATSITSGRAASSTASSDLSDPNRKALVKMIELISKQILTM